MKSMVLNHSIFGEELKDQKIIMLINGIDPIDGTKS